MRNAWHPGPAELVRRATDADSRKHTDSLEAPRHYLDVDDLPIDPRDSLPVPWGRPHAEADSLMRHTTGHSLTDVGILPWQIQWSYRRLVAALAADSLDVPRVERLAADLGHYLGDAHVPLHTSAN